MRAWILPVMCAGLASLGPLAGPADAGVGYVYEARSYYVAPPVVYYYAPIIEPAPIVVYDTPAAVPLPPAGYYVEYPAPVPRTTRYRERWRSSPYREHYRYDADVRGGPDYGYRYDRRGNRVRIRERWDD